MFVLLQESQAIVMKKELETEAEAKLQKKNREVENLRSKLKV